MKISSVKHLTFILKCKSSDVELMKFVNQLSDKSYQFDKQFYREKQEKKELKNGKLKTRILNPSLGRLKLLQTRIKENILDQIQFPDYIQGGLKGCSNITNASKHLGNKFKFTTDIKGFFPSVKYKQVYRVFSQLSPLPEVARLLTCLTTYKGHLPQGTPTSSHLANMVFLEVDKKIERYCSEKGITYTRYIDDITLSAPFDFKNMLDVIIDFINQAGFKISSRKTQYRHILDITGVSTGNNQLKPNKKFYQKLSEEQTDAQKLARISYLQRVIASKKHSKAKMSPNTSPKKKNPHQTHV
jgi:RNA-directed DNA polymerase